MPVLAARALDTAWRALVDKGWAVVERSADLVGRAAEEVYYALGGPGDFN